MAEALARRCRPLLGTLVEIAVPRAAAGAVDAAFAAVAHVHARMSFHEETSDLAHLRRAPAGAAVPVDPETVAVLRLAAALREASGGVFDVSVGARLVAAGFLPRPPSVDLRRMTGAAADIEILDDHRVRCRRPLLIDLGGIAKGHAVDRAVETLLAAGVPRGIVNAGGDLRVFGPAAELVHLRGADGALEGALALQDGALASSSNRHLRRRRAGRELSPHWHGARRAVLAEAAVTVVAPRCAIADAMTKVALADPSLARTMLARWGGALVDRDALRRAA
jgi:thiamine biosynthesis lipoprotein